MKLFGNRELTDIMILIGEYKNELNFRIKF